MTKKKSVLLVLVATVAAMVLGACEPGDPWRATGSYPIDIFQEMHYNQTQKAQEPPRFLPPEGSMPVAGGFIPAPSGAAAEDLENPYEPALERGALLYRQNCSMCHGLTAQGDGYVGERFNVSTPPAFDSPRVQGLSPGRAYVSISNGVGFMPAFQSLLTEEDRWALVSLIEASASERNAALQDVNDYGDNVEAEIDRALRLRELKGLEPGD